MKDKTKELKWHRHENSIYLEADRDDWIHFDKTSLQDKQLQMLIDDLVESHNAAIDAAFNLGLQSKRRLAISL